jgi:prepilin peptidase dependent protein B
MRPSTPCPTRARGISMVELLVGLAVGLFIAAAGVTLMAGNLRENRALMLESRLMQDLRTAADIITRDLRRAGYWAGAVASIQVEPGSPIVANPYLAVAPAAAASDSVSFAFSRDASENQTLDSNEQFGFRLRRGVIEMQLGSGNWQALTDANTVVVTGFVVTPTTEEVSLAEQCSRPCPAVTPECLPRQQVRSLDVSIQGRSSADASVQRGLRSSVRLRNDAVVGACPA